MKHYTDLKHHNEKWKEDRGTAAVLTLFGLTLAAGMAGMTALAGNGRPEAKTTVVEQELEMPDLATTVAEVAETVTSEAADVTNEQDAIATDAIAKNAAAETPASTSVANATEAVTSEEGEGATELFSKESTEDVAMAEQGQENSGLKANATTENFTQSTTELTRPEQDVSEAFDYATMTPAKRREFLQKLMPEASRKNFTEAAKDKKSKEYKQVSITTNPQVMTYLTGDYHPNARSLVNAKRACHYLNGTVVAPGEEFSYNKVLGERTTSRGYINAPSITSATMEMTVGGGICQISSLLYQVCLQSNMEIVERHPHTLIVPYADNGFDASVVWDQWDFRFRNPYDYPVMILAYSEDASESVSIFMVTNVEDPLHGMTYEMRAEQTGDYSFHNYIDVYDHGNLAETRDMGINEYMGEAVE